LARRALAVALCSLAIGFLAACGGSAGVPSPGPRSHSLRLDRVDQLIDALLTIQRSCHGGAQRKYLGRAVRTLVAIYRETPRATYISNPGERPRTMRQTLETEASYLRGCRSRRQLALVERALHGR